MVRITPVTPVPSRPQSRSSRPSPSLEPALDGEWLEAGVEPTLASPPPCERRRGHDRRQRRTLRPYLDGRCGKDRRRQSVSRIDVEI